METQTQQIKTHIEALLEHMGVAGTVDIFLSSDSAQFSIHTQDGGALIGENGQRLAALNHIVRKIAERICAKNQHTAAFPITVDVNDYQAKKTEELRDLARMSAQRVRYFKKNFAMRPMTSFERRIVHTTLSSSPDITTESEGEGAQRHVVIKIYNPTPTNSAVAN